MATSITMLAKRWDGHSSVPSDWWWSYKRDGVRGLLSSDKLRSRYGNRFWAPGWWLARLAKQDCIYDGELTHPLGRQECLSIVRSHDGGRRWSDISFHCFDIYDRCLREAYDSIPLVFRIKQMELGDNSVPALLNNALELGFEGLMLRDPDREYAIGKRVNYMLKVKPVCFGSGLLISYNDGKGRNLGVVGGYRLLLDNGVALSIGQLPDWERRNPKKIGSVIEFTYRDVTNSGVPLEAKISKKA